MFISLDFFLNYYLYELVRCLILEIIKKEILQTKAGYSGNGRGDIPRVSRLVAARRHFTSPGREGQVTGQLRGEENGRKCPEIKIR